MACLFYHLELATLFVAVLLPQAFMIPVLIAGGTLALLLDIAITKNK